MIIGFKILMINKRNMSDIWKQNDVCMAAKECYQYHMTTIISINQSILIQLDVRFSRVKTYAFRQCFTVCYKVLHAFIGMYTNTNITMKIYLQNKNKRHNESR